MKLSQADVYRRYEADYGCLVGRVVVNGRVGVPNVKVSIFIPVDDLDKSDDVIFSLYPYETVTDVNSKGIRYNVLPQYKVNDCHIPVGSLPSKEALLDNPIYEYIHRKYYKFTTVTNASGDYMFMGAPLGVQMVHADADLSDVGFLSVKPYDLIAQGYNENLFNSHVEFKFGTDLNSLSQIQTRDITANIIPFWGDNQNNNVGFTRLDIELGVTLTPNALFMGSIYADNKNASINRRCRPRRRMGRNCDFTTGEGSVECRRLNEFADTAENVPLGEYAQVDEHGNWIAAIPMNKGRYITDEEGNLVPSQDPTIGIPTQADVRFRIGINERINDQKFRTAYYLVPNMYNRFDFDNPVVNTADFFSMNWNQIYTVTNYIPRYQRNTNDNNANFTGISRIGECENTSPFPYNRINSRFNPLFLILCILITAISIIIGALNNLFGRLFRTVIATTCTLQHLGSAQRRGECRCSFCYNFNNDGNSSPSCPPAMSQVDCDCAEIYDPENAAANPPACNGRCTNCVVTLVALPCEGVNYADPSAWKDCILEVLARELGVVRFEFYNDWIVGSLYSFAFKYKLKIKRRRRVAYEIFCDLNCREAIGGTPSQSDVNYKNRCKTTYIVDRAEFNNSGNSGIISVNGGIGRGLLVSDGGYMYYASRWDFGVNDPNVTDLIVGSKHRLLFATNIISLGANRSCNLGGTPFIINDLESTSHQVDEGNRTLFTVSDCLSATNINRNGALLESQAGIEIEFAQTSENSNLVFDEDDEAYTLSAGFNPTLMPDYDNNDGILVLNRNIEIRQYLCENFQFYAVQGQYVSTDRPALGDPFLSDPDGDVLEYVTDNCVNFDDNPNRVFRLHPYYMYFGSKQGNSVLDRLKNNYTKDC